MVTTIAEALGRIKKELARVLEPAMLAELAASSGTSGASGCSIP